MKLSRRCTSPLTYSLVRSINGKMSSRNNSYSSSVNRNPELQNENNENDKLLPDIPQRGISSSRRTSIYTAQRNTRNQLGIIQQKIGDLRQEIYNARMGNNEMFKYVKGVRKQLMDNLLNKDVEELKCQISAVKKLLGVTKVSHENRSKELRNCYFKLWDQTEELRQKVFEIRIKMDKIQDVMGLRNL